MSVLLVFVLLIAVILLLFEPSSGTVSVVKESVSVVKNSVPTEEFAKSMQAGSLDDVQDSVDRGIENNSEEINGVTIDDDINQSIIYDLSQPESEISNSNFDNENEGLMAIPVNSDEPLATELSVRQKSLKTVTNSVQQSEAAENTEESPALGDKEIAGQVQDVRGKPVSAVSIQLRVQSPGADAPDSTFTRHEKSDLAGEFKFRNLADGDYRLMVSAKNRYGKVSHITRAGTSNLVLVLPDNHNVIIQGLVSDVNDQPVSGVSVSIDGKDETKTNADGHYQIINTYEIDSNHRLVFLLDGFREVNELIKVSSNSMTVDKQLQYKSQLQLSGQIIDDYGIPLPKAAIWLYSRSAEIERRIHSDDGGYFSVDDLKPGSDYQFTVSFAGHEKYSQSSLEITKSSEPMRIKLKGLSTGMLTGNIVDAIGYPVPNYAMKIVNASASADIKIVTSDYAGQFEEVSVFEGILQFSSMSKPRSSISGINLSAGDNLFLTLVVDHGEYEIFGGVIDEDGRGVPNAKITMTWTHSADGLKSRSNRNIQTDSKGDFRIQNIGPGTHTLVAAAEGFKNTRVNINPEQYTGSLSITLMR